MGKKFPIQPLEGRQFCPEKFLTYVASGSELFFPAHSTITRKWGLGPKRKMETPSPQFLRENVH